MCSLCDEEAAAIGAAKLKGGRQMKLYSPQEILEWANAQANVPCPVCQAKPTLQCVQANGEPFSVPHTNRLERYRADKEAYFKTLTFAEKNALGID